MYPSIIVFGKSVFVYDILTNVGTILGLAVMFIMLYKYGTRNKRVFAAYSISLILSYPFGRILRGIIEADNIGELMFCGIHFMGVVFAFYFIFPIIYRWICKKTPTEEIKGFSVLYFSIQHFFSRLGCFSLGCCFGVYYTGIFSIIFPYGTNPYTVYGKEIPIFPTQFFEGFCALGLFIMSFMLILRHKKVYGLFIILFCLSIFISENFMYKYAYERTIFSFSYIQLCCVVLIFIEGCKMIRRRLIK